MKITLSIESKRRIVKKVFDSDSDFDFVLFRP